MILENTENATNAVRYGLLRVPERKFPHQIEIADAQYVYRALGDIPPCEDAYLPYFYHAIPRNSFSGISKTADGRQFNAMYREEEAEDPFSSYKYLLGG